MFKVILCGNSSVGKTTLIQRLSNQIKDTPPNPTMGAGFASFNTEVDGKDVPLNLWDTAGQEQYRSLIKIYFRGAELAVFVIDVTSRESFDQLPFWMAEVEQNSGQVIPAGLIIANKTDFTDRIVVGDAEIETAANMHNVQWIKVSARTGENCNRIIPLIAKICVEHKNDPTYNCFGNQKVASTAEIRKFRQILPESPLKHENSENNMTDEAVEQQPIDITAENGESRGKCC